MIWGLTLKPGELHAETIKDEVQLSMAALESRTQESTEVTDYNQVIVQTESAEYVLCTLVHGSLFQQYLDMKLMPGEQVKFCVQGKYTVHLTGYSTCLPKGYSIHAPSTGENDESNISSLPSADGQADDSGWQLDNVQVVKQELVEEAEVVDVSGEASFEEDGYAKPAIRVSPVRSSHYNQQPISEQSRIQQQPLHRTLAQQRRPLVQHRQQHRHQQRAQIQWQTRARRRFTPGQRSQMAFSRQRGGLLQQRKVQRNLPSSNMRSGPRIRVQPATPQPSSHPSPVQSIPQHSLQQQQVIPRAVSMGMPPSTSMSEDVTYPIAVQQLSDIAGTQIQDLPGNTTSDYPPHSMTDLGDGITLTDSLRTSMQTLPSTSMPNIQGSSDGYTPETSITNIHNSSIQSVHGTSLMDVSGTSVANMPGPSSAHMGGRSSVDIPGSSQDMRGQQEEMAPHRMYVPESRSFKTSYYEGGKVYRCHFCSDTFTDKALFKMHEILQHGDMKCRQCSVCKKIFSTQSSLNLHMRTHYDGKPFQCSYCQRAFKRRDVCRVHERTHSGEKPYSCRFCSRTFSQSSARLCHERGQHGKNLSSKISNK